MLNLPFFNIFFKAIQYLQRAMRQLLLRQKQILFFALAGGLSALIEILSFKLFSIEIPYFFIWEENWHGIHYPLSNTLSTTLGIVSNYFFSIWFVFKRGKHSKRKEAAYFFLLSLLTMLLSLIVFQFFYSYLFTNQSIDLKFYIFSSEMLSKVSAIVLVSIINYSIKKRVVFNG